MLPKYHPKTYLISQNKNRKVIIIAYNHFISLTSDIKTHGWWKFVDIFFNILNKKGANYCVKNSFFILVCQPIFTFRYGIS